MKRMACNSKKLLEIIDFFVDIQRWISKSLEKVGCIMNLRLELFVKSIENSIEFYREILEFDVPKESDCDYVPIEKGNVRLGLGSMENLPEYHPLRVSNDNHKNGLGIEIVLEVEEINAFYKKVVSKGYPIETGLSERPWGLTDFRLMDPDGYYFRMTSMAKYQ